MLWGLGVGYVISGMYFGWNLGLEQGGTLGLAVATLSNALYAIGGLDDAACFDTVERYDPASDVWNKVAPMNIPRGGVGVAVMKVHYWCLVRAVALGFLLL